MSKDRFAKIRSLLCQDSWNTITIFLIIGKTYIYV